MEWQTLPIGEVGYLVRIIQRKSYIGPTQNMVNLQIESLSI